MNPPRAQLTDDQRPDGKGCRQKHRGDRPLDKRTETDTKCVHRGLPAGTRVGRGYAHTIYPKAYLRKPRSRGSIRRGSGPHGPSKRSMLISSNVYGHRHADDRRPAGHGRKGQDRPAGGHRARHQGPVLLLPPGPRHRRLLPRLHRQDREDAEAADVLLDAGGGRHGRRRPQRPTSSRRAPACSSSC